MANRRLNTVITIGGTVARSLMGSLTTTRGRIGELGGSLRQLERQQRNLNNSIDTFRRMGANADRLRERLRGVTEEIQRQRREMERLRAVDRNSESRGRIGGKIGETVAVGAAIALPAAAALKTSADFNYTLQVIGNTAEMTGADVKKLGLDIINTSRDVGKTAVQTQEAMGFLVAAGMDVTTARNNLRTVGRTATATASDIQDVAKASYTLGDALKIDPSQMQQALDILVMSGKEGNFEFKDMAAELPVLGAAVQALKMNGLEATATLGAALQIARKGAGTSQQAATNVENFLAKVMSPETLKKASKMGSNLYGVISGAQKKGANPFEAAIKEINRITKGGDQKKLGELFQDMQVQNFLRPMLQNLDEYEQIKTKALAARNVVDKDFIKMSATTKAQFDGMTASAGRAAIAIGGSLEPAAGKLFSTLAPLADKVEAFTQNNSELVGGTILVVGGLVAMKTAALALAFGYTVLKGGVLSTIGVFRAVPAVIAFGSTVMTAGATAARALGAAFMFAGRGMLAMGAAMFANPIGLTILAVVALGAAVYAVYKNWEPIKTWFKGLWSDITATFDKGVEWITKKMAWVGDKWRGFKSGLGFGDDKPTTAPVQPMAATAPQPGQKPMAAPQPKPLPPLPSMAPGKGGAAPVTDQRSYTFHIAPQPGQSPQQIADEVMRQVRNQQGVRARSSMIDQVG